MTSRPLSILLVEDNLADARLIREYLADFGGSGFRLDHAETLADALRRSAGAVDAVLLDLDLPDSQGVPNVVEIAGRFPEAAITVLTGRNEAVVAAAAVRAGAQDYVVKDDIRGPGLVQVVRAAIARKSGQELERLRHREKLQKDFIANVSHEFRTPLAAIKGAVDILQQDSGLASRKRAEFLDIIARHAERLSALVENVLLVSSLDAAQSPPSLRPLALKAAVDQCLSDLAVMADKHEVRLAMDVPGGLRVKADAGQLGRVLENLCANAVEYNKRGGGVSVSAKTDGGEAVISVRDTGQGIPSAELPQIFERFHRTARSRASKLAGTGLGLMIVKRLVSCQNGRIWVESVEGKGSTFRFTLPLA